VSAAAETEIKTSSARNDAPDAAAAAVWPKRCGGTDDGKFAVLSWIADVLSRAAILFGLSFVLFLSK